MHTLIRTMSCLALAAFSAQAIEKDVTARMMESARNIERDARAVSVALKSKQIDAEHVRTKIGAMEADISLLREAVAEFEAANHSPGTHDEAVWKRIKDKVTLLEIFHGNKKKLAEEDFGRNRRQIRSYAAGVAQRARMLQDSLARA